MPADPTKQPYTDAGADLTERITRERDRLARFVATQSEQIERYGLIIATLVEDVGRYFDERQALLEDEADEPIWWRRGYDGQWQRVPPPHVAEWLRQSAAAPLSNRVDDIERLRARIQGNPAGLLGATEPPPDEDIAAGRTVRFDTTEEMDAALLNATVVRAAEVWRRWFVGSLVRMQDLHDTEQALLYALAEARCGRCRRCADCRLDAPFAVTEEPA